MRIEEVKAYEVEEIQEIKELNSIGYLCRHKKTGARVVLLENEDENKVFYIGFRTTPEESTGVSHILEHSVLCGSKHFPVKDPFIELAKGSLNTFLNAMTYPDKTVYPVASCNDKDFANLMHVYLDAVFYPNIYDHDLTFRQEGWHYELEEEDGELKINGVVYNEMKGAFSSPDDVLEREILNSLFPDNAYREESGGDPDCIPDLTYEHYLEVHRTYYHPSNSYIYLYGNMDMAERLDFLDKEYLSKYEALEVDSALKKQEAFEKLREVQKEYSVAEGEPTEGNTYLSYNIAMSDNLNRKQYLVFQILDYVLCSAPGAPLKQALLDAGIGKDIYSFYDNGVQQPYFSIVAKNTELSRKEEFVTLITQTLWNLCKTGLDKKALRAGLNYYEFKYREGDFGSYPPGLMYGLQILDSWLYDDTKPFIHIEAEDTFEYLKAQIRTPYFEEQIEQFILNNPHKSIVSVVPVVNLAEKKEEELKKRLQEYKNSLSAEERRQIVERTHELLAYQEEEDSPEALACIPVLNREDIKKETEKLYNEKRIIDGATSLYHPVFTNKIGYLRVLFQADGVPQRLLTYLGILKSVLGYVDTEKYTYNELFNVIHLETGGMVPVVNLYTDSKDLTRCRVTFEVKAKALEKHIGKAFRLVDEILMRSRFEDDKRLYEIIAELKSRMQSNMTQAGHQVAAGRASAYFSVPAALSETVNGVPLYRLVETLEKNFEEKKEELKNALQELCQYLFRPENLMYDFTGSREGYKRFENAVRGWKKKLHQEPLTEAPYVVIPEKKNEGFITAGQVQYVAKAGNFIEKGLPYTGALRVLKVILGYDYLWNQVRVKGGAYGCMCSFAKNGDSYFVSYRDPNLSKTLDAYEAAAAYLKNFGADERSMTQYVIGAISELDAPLTPAAKGLRSLSAYMTNQTEADFQEERDQLLATETDTIRALAEYVERFLQEDCICVVGTKGKIEESQELFRTTRNLF